MVEPPSQELVRQLTELQLCLPSDLHRARGRVRCLSYDLTAFDSVWIDSLVQLRLLSPYQAKQLEDGHADRLRIGSFVVIDEIGRSDRGTTLLARRLHRRDRCVIKRQHLEQERSAEANQQLQCVIERATGFAHPQLVLPSEILTTDRNELIAVSRFVPGLPLNELLVRRGRFPAAVVFEIGRQLLDGLAALHARSLVHGDIRMSNVRLTETGLAVLVDGAVRQVVHPEVTIHETQSLEAYDGIAPELIGTGAAASASSEMYALGCLLWQLLAGRPPFTTADPLAKLASHQSLTIDDVRVWAPETPAALAETIRQMTAPAAVLRPRSFDEILQRWGRPSAFGRSRLRQYRRLFDGAVPHFADAQARTGKGVSIWIVAMLFALTGSVAMLYDKGFRTELLDVVHNVNSAVKAPVDPSNSSSAGGTPSSRSGHSGDLDRALIPLPAPSADGVIVLRDDGPYEASQITFAGNLTIRAVNGVRPEIQVEDSPLCLAAHSVSLENITVRCQNENAPRILVKIRCQQAKIAHCAFLTRQPHIDANETTSSRGQGTASLGWAPLDSRDPQSGQLTISDTIFDGTGAAVLFAKSPRLIQVSNSLKTGHGEFACLGPKCVACEMKFKLHNVTLRGTGPLLWLSGESASKSGSPPAQIEATDSVFALADATSGLVVIDSERPRADLERSIQMNARESVVAPGTALLTTFDPMTKLLRQEDADEQFDGLVAGGIEFTGPDLHRAVDSKTARIQGPRVGESVERLPGVNPRALGPAALSH